MDFQELFTRLRARLPGAGFNGTRNPYSVLVSTIISQRTKDEQTHAAARTLLSEFPTAEKMAKADIRHIQQLIRPAGFYRVKAKNIREVSRILVEKYNGDVPDEYDSLIRLPSVGQKTANCVLVFGFGKQAIPVDTHVHRISNRLGIIATHRPEDSEVQLRKILPKKYWLDINHLFVRFGREICKPQKPLCKSCPVFDMCDWSGKSY